MAGFEVFTEEHAAPEAFEKRGVLFTSPKQTRQRQNPQTEGLNQGKNGHTGPVGVKRSHDGLRLTEDCV